MVPGQRFHVWQRFHLRRDCTQIWSRCYSSGMLAAVPSFKVQVSWRVMG